MQKERTSFSIKEWSDGDKPREKLISKGQTLLSDAELIAILIGSGNRNESAVALSQRILAASGNNLNALGRLSVEQLMRFKGIGKAKAVTIAAALEMGRRRRVRPAQRLAKITASADVFHIMQGILGDLQHEEFWIIYLNNANRIIHKAQISKGGITGTLVDVRLIMKQALEVGAIGLVLVHNHPSGNLDPSAADKQITNKLIQAAQSLDLKVLDHLIVTQKQYFSFADNSLI